MRLSLIQPTKWAKHGEGQIMPPLRNTWTREVFRTHLFASLGACPLWLTGGACLSSIKKHLRRLCGGLTRDAEQSSVFRAGCKYLTDTGGWLHCSLHHLLTSCCLVSAPYEEGRYDHLIHNSCTHLHEIHEAKHEAARVSWDIILILLLFIANNQSHQGLLLLQFSHSSSLCFTQQIISFTYCHLLWGYNRNAVKYFTSLNVTHIHCFFILNFITYKNMNPGQTHVLQAGLCSGWVWEPYHKSDLPPYVDPGLLLLSVKQKRQSEVWETQTCLFFICGQSRLLQLRPEVKHTWTNITRLMERRCSDVTLTPAGHVSA